MLSTTGLVVFSLKSLRCQAFRSICVSKCYNVQSPCTVSGSAHARAVLSHSNTLVGHWLLYSVIHKYYQIYICGFVCKVVSLTEVLPV